MQDFDKGALRIDAKEDRETVARILFKNGYAVFPAKIKKDGKSYTQLVSYEYGVRIIGEEEYR